MNLNFISIFIFQYTSQPIHTQITRAYLADLDLPSPSYLSAFWYNIPFA